MHNEKVYWKSYLGRAFGMFNEKRKMVDIFDVLFTSFIFDFGGRICI